MTDAALELLQRLSSWRHGSPRWTMATARTRRKRGAVPTRLRTLQRDLLDSLWFTPTVIALVYAALALVLLRADQALGLDTQGRDAWAVGGADGARGVLFAIAGTTLSVLGVVFSLTIVVLQIASAQFTPRVMRNLTGDRGTQVVLGVSWAPSPMPCSCYVPCVPGRERGRRGFAPGHRGCRRHRAGAGQPSFMIYTINHVARSVQVAVIIKRVTHDTLELFDEPLAGEIDAAPRSRPIWIGAARRAGETIASQGDGYLEAIDAGAWRPPRCEGWWCEPGSGWKLSSGRRTVGDGLAPGDNRRGPDGELPLRLCAGAGANTAAGRRAGDSAVSRHRGAGFVAGHQRPDHGHLVHRPSRSMLVRAASRDETEVLSGPSGGRHAARTVLCAADRRRLHSDPALRGGRRGGGHAPDDVVGEIAARVSLTQQEPLRACRCTADGSTRGP